MAAALPQMLGDLEQLVGVESPSDVRDAVARSADAVAKVARERLGTEPERVVIDGRSHLRWRFGDGDDANRVLVLGHHDTVWPLGSLGTHPFAVAGRIARGAGCFDMKAGLVIALHALAALDDRRGITLLVTGDEEIGSPSSRELIEAEATGCAAALVLEPSADGGALKCARKGYARYELVVHGRAAHAGLEPHAGVNATVELARQVLQINQLGRPERGTSVTPTLLAAGTTTNTVPATGSVAIDVRFRDAAEHDRVERGLRALAPTLVGSKLELRGGPDRPALEPSASAALFDLAVSVSARLGLAEPQRAAVGGASDGNFTAGIGVPTLDGLGAVGGGAHSASEHVLIDALPNRATLVAALLGELLATPAPESR